ncbi:hypothetical protein MSM1_08095 [Mycobacterium sp. SM1]|uniref:hypothetical protein n=1 Tax=Mycobacterium sp. SM1 TaxID=2816243 RepID=UPI001BCBD5EE|nr:hypothetical protein [Mycobacterium sp. SM1]MBS4728306.1 hypothetical protein [Mycobacterium sp. SM1]
MTLRVACEGLVATGGGFQAVTARLATEDTGVVSLITAMVPLAVDPMSLMSAGGSR